MNSSTDLAAGPHSLFATIILCAEQKYREEGKKGGGGEGVKIT